MTRAEECENYLNFGVKEGFIDEESAMSLIEREDWGAVERIMAQGDYYADVARKQD